MIENLADNKLKNYLKNVDDHIFSLNSFAENTEEKKFEIQKEVERIFIYSEEFLEEQCGVTTRTNMDKNIYKNSLEKILEYTEDGGRDINRIIGICCDGLYESRE